MKQAYFIFKKGTDTIYFRNMVGIDESNIEEILKTEYLENHHIHGEHSDDRYVTFTLNRHFTVSDISYEKALEIYENKDYGVNDAEFIGITIANFNY